MTIIVAPAGEAASLVARHRPCRILSLMSPDAEPAVFDRSPQCVHLHLQFNDISQPQPYLTAPSRDHVARMIDFGKDWDGTTPFLIHCWAGISRSPAAAFVLACQHGRAGEERAIAKMLRQASPSATPNPLIVALADDLLGRNGAMIDAIAAIGRGQDATQGLPFELNRTAERP